MPSLGTHTLMLFLLATVSATACKTKPAQRCPEFDDAQALFYEISGQTLDPAFEDPRYEPAAAAFEAIAEDCARHETALMTARTIRDGLARGRAAAARPAPSPVFVPPKAPPAPRVAAPSPPPAPRPTKAKSSGPDLAQLKKCLDIGRAFATECGQRLGCPDKDSEEDKQACAEVCMKELHQHMLDYDCSNERIRNGPR